MARHQSLVRRAMPLGRSLAVVFAALIALALMLVVGLFVTARKTDYVETSNQTQLIDTYLTHAVAKVVNEQKSQAIWDDALISASGNMDELSLDRKLGNYLWRYYRHDVVVLTDGKARLLRIWVNGKPAAPSAFAPIHRDVELFLNELKQKRAIYPKQRIANHLKLNAWADGNHDNPNARWSGHIISHNGAPAIMGMSRIVPDFDMRLLANPERYLVSVRSFDPQFLGQMSGLLKLDELTVERGDGKSEERAYASIHTDAGNVAGRLSWTPARPGTMMRGMILPLLSAVLLVLITAVGLTLRNIRRGAIELRASEGRAQHLALHDQMTGLPNRLNFQQNLSAAAARLATGEGKREILVVYLDLDRFKEINDTMGHHAGDDLIRLVGARLEAQLGPGDILARLGGDEFVLMRETDHNPDNPARLAKSILAAFDHTVEVMGIDLSIAASCGVAVANTPISDPSDLLRNADIALYEAKREMGSSWRLFSPKMDDSLRLRRDIEVELRKAISENRLDLAYQPIFNAETRKITGIEALARWTHPTRGAVPPTLFVSVAEQSGLMAPLGLWVFERACRDANLWPGLNVSINLSPVQLKLPSIVEDLEGILERTGVSAHHFTLEITENVLIDSADRMLVVVERLRAIGFKIALDDFGTGYSSLNYLRRFSFDKIKIDRAFIQNIDTDFDSLSIIKAVTNLARTMRISLVAEGVETPMQSQLLIAAGCPDQQGFLFWKPMKAAELLEALGTNDAEWPAVDQRQQQGPKLKRIHG